jgi:hypothetical protein
MIPEPDTLAYAGHGPGQPPSRKLPTLIVRRRAHTVVFASGFRIGSKEATPLRLDAVVGHGGQARLLVRVDNELIGLRLPLRKYSQIETAYGFDLPSAHFETDAPVASVRMTDGRLTALALVDGQSLEAGKIRVSSSRKATLSLSLGPDDTARLTVQAGGATDVRLSGLFAGEVRIATAAGRLVPSTWRDGTVAFEAEPGRYTLRAAKR